MVLQLSPCDLLLVTKNINSQHFFLDWRGWDSKYQSQIWNDWRC